MKGEVKMGQCYNIKQAAELLGIKVRTVREWIKLNKLHAEKYECSNRWFVSEEEINRIRGEKNIDNKN